MKKVALIFAGILVVVIVGVFVASECGVLEPSHRGGMEAEVGTQPGAIHITNKNDFPWYGLIITLNEKYSNRLLMDRGNWPYFLSTRVHNPGETKTIPFGGNFVYSEDRYLDDTDVWWTGIAYTNVVDRIQLDAKSQVDGDYDLRATHE